MTDVFNQGALPLGAVAKRPVFHPKLGQFFRDLRLAHGWGLRQAARIAAERGLSSLNMNSLGALERGAVKNPEPELFRELAVLYKHPYAELVGAYLAQRYGVMVTNRDLPDHRTGVQDVTSDKRPVHDQTGGPHDAGTVRAFREVTAAHDSFFRAVQDLSDRLARLVQGDAVAAEHRKTADALPRRRRRR